MHCNTGKSKQRNEVKSLKGLHPMKHALEFQISLVLMQNGGQSLTRPVKLNSKSRLLLMTVACVGNTQACGGKA